jgi:glycosyltransferase involved in cell wall biosynthesis
MKICFFGIYDPAYARNRVLMSGLKAHGYEIVECRVDPRTTKGIAKFRELFKAAININKREIDAVIVAFPGHSVVWLAYLLFGRKRLIFDAFLSLYDSNVYDRKRYKPNSLKAYKDWFLDWHSTKLASRVLVDTNAHIEYFKKMFGVAADKLIRVLIGADQEVFYPHSRQNAGEFLIHFHGTFIPLQGLEYIIDAALQLPGNDAIFQIVGDGQEGKMIRKKIAEHNADYIKMVGSVPVTEVPGYIAQADICLGIFGNTEKTQRVIPNKVYECLAMGKLVVTADTPAIREIFTEKELVLCPVADSKALAQTIRELKNNPDKVKKIAAAGYQFFTAKLNPRAIVEPLVSYVNKAYEK